MKKFHRLIALPCVILLIAVYLIGANAVKKTDKIGDIREEMTAYENTYKTEEEENSELDTITDKININTATESELMLLDGIGESIAERIIEKREEIGGFGTPEEIMWVSGVGEKIFEKIENYITVD